MVQTPDFKFWEMRESRWGGTKITVKKFSEVGRVRWKGQIHFPMIPSDWH